LRWTQTWRRRRHRVDNVYKDLNVVLQVLKPHGKPRWSHSKRGSMSARRETSESVRREVQDSVHPLRLCMSKWVRFPNAVVCGAFPGDGVGEDEWELPLTRESRKESQRCGVVVSKAR